jgi:LysR family glycine cleavage system transcriptional activator
MNALKAFDAAARCQGFSAAAQELNVSPGAISRHVANLEDYLGVQLFHRKHNEISLTPQGERYFARIRAPLDIVEDASRLMIESANPRQLHITAMPSFALHWLIPRLPRFGALHPRVDIQLSTDIAQVEEMDFDLDAIDIAFHFSISDKSSEHCDRLFETELLAVCSPALAAGSPGIASAPDVAAHMLLSTANGLTQWRQWFDIAGIAASVPTRSMMFGNSSLALQAAIHGVGVALAESAFVRDDISAGRLVAPLDLRLYTDNKYYMSINPARAEMPAVTAFRAWLLSEIEQAGEDKPPTT